MHSMSNCECPIFHVYKPYLLPATLALKPSNMLLALLLFLPLALSCDSPPSGFAQIGSHWYRKNAFWTAETNDDAQDTCEGWGAWVAVHDGTGERQQEIWDALGNTSTEYRCFSEETATVTTICISYKL